MTDHDEKTPTKPQLPPQRVRTGEPGELRTILTNAVKDATKPLHDSVLELGARQGRLERAVAAMTAARLALPVAAFVLSALALGAIVSLHARPAQALTRCAPAAPEPAGGR